ncbi:MAG: class I SAM-dependent RNA methyltransferase, partial [Spirochaetota bacterium]
GRVVLVPFAVPGDVADLVFDRSGGGTCFGWIREVLEPSPDRVASRCPVFGICGGCSLDMMSYQSELQGKRDILLEDLDRIGGLQGRVEETVPSEREHGYRNHAQFKVDARGRVGFFMRRSHELVPLPEQGCLLMDERINACVRDLRGRTAFRQGGFRVRVNREGEIFQKGIPGMRPDAFARYTVEGLVFTIGIDDFFQVNSFVVAPWLRRIRAYLDPREDQEVLDLYCGAGVIALFLAGSAGRVTGVEHNGSAVRSARSNAEANGVRNVRFLQGDVTRGLPRELRADAVVVDPPRTGLSGPLVADLLELSPRRLVYASCNTATFSRDAAALARGGMALERISLLDMFPRTHHLELVALFTPQGT